MSGKYLLDTNIVIAIFNKDNIVANKLSSITEVFIPSIVIGELCYGAEKSSHSKENLNKIRLFAGASSILSCDLETSCIYGHLKNILRQKGKPIPDNDIWIAAIAKQYHLTLATRDEHFASIPDVSTVTW
jgi:tRNA(fMet)-specific endonuclease VapC